jgi:ABC-type Fe3+ transport system permease subunit
MSGQYPDQQRPSGVGYGGPPHPEQSQATTVFVLGLLGLLVFPLLAPFAWTMGTRELAAIDAGRRPPDNRHLARIGQILGIVMSSLLILFVVVIVALVVVSL